MPLNKHVVKVGGVELLAGALRDSLSDQLTSLEIVRVAEALDRGEFIHLSQVTLHELAQSSLAVKEL